MSTPPADPPGRRRTATPDDAARLRAIQRDCLAKPAPALLAGALGGAGIVVVSEAAEADDFAANPTVVGYALAVPGDDAATLAELAVAPAARRRGHGRALVTAVLDRCRSAGVSRLRVHASRAAGDAHAFYEALGFQRTDTVSDYYDDGTAAVAYERPIDELGE